MIRILAPLLGCLLLSGCQSPGAAFSNAVTETIGLVTGGAAEIEPPRELTSITPEVRIHVLWDRDVGAGDGGRLLDLTVAADGEDGILYAADCIGRVTALKIRDGSEVFAIETDQPLSAGPGLGPETLLLGTADARLLSLERQNGRLLWSAPVSSEVLATPAVEGGVIIAHTGDGAVFALAEDSGRLLWSYGQKVGRLSLRGVAPPQVIGDQVLIGFAKGRMSALRISDGKLLWEKQVAVPKGISELERVVDIDSRPAVRKGILYVTAYHGGVIAASMVDGEVIWRNPEIISQGSPAVTWSYVFVTDVHGDLWGLDEATGRAYWKQDALHRRRLTAPVIFRDYIAVGDYKGYVHFLAQEDGRLVGRIRAFRSPIHIPPSVVGDYLIVYASDGGLAVLTIESSRESE